MYCSKCGTQNSESDVYCRKCGQPLNEAASTYNASANKTQIPPITVVNSQLITCVHCGKQVEPQKPGFGCGWALLWFLLGIIPGIIYIIYNRSKPANKCPACGKNVYK